MELCHSQRSRVSILYRILASLLVRRRQSSTVFNARSKDALMYIYRQAYRVQRIYLVQLRWYEIYIYNKT